MKNNRDNFKPGKKPFSRDGDRRFGSDRPNQNSSGRPNNFAGKSNYSSNKNKSGGGFGRFNKTDRNDNRSDRSDRNDNRNGRYDNRNDRQDNRSARYDNRNDRFDRNDRKPAPYNKNPRFEKSDRPFEKKFDKPFDRKPVGNGFNRSERSERPERKFDKPFEKRSDRPFEKKFDKPFERKSGGGSGFNKPNYNKFNKNDRFGNTKSSDRYNRPERPTFKETTNNIADAPDVAIVEQENSGMVYGRNAVIELLKSGKSIDKLFVQSGQREGSITMIFAEAVKKAIPVIEVEKVKLDSMINNSAHQGVIALASEKEYCSVDDILKIAEDREEKPFILIADKIMDPHNLGAVIRTAECAGVHGIIIPKRNAAGVSPIVTKTSAGASIHMAIAKVANIANTISELKDKGVWIFSSALDANSETDGREITDYDAADYNMPLALVVGNEGEGLAPIVIQNSDFLVKIPMRGEIESLNVSCASAVLMYEASRQRKRK